MGGEGILWVPEKCVKYHVKASFDFLYFMKKIFFLSFVKKLLLEFWFVMDPEENIEI